MKKSYLLLLCFAFYMKICSAQNTWTQKAAFAGIGRMGATAFSIGAKGYVGTGGDFGSNYYNDFWEYDQLTDSWTQKANFPGTARYRALGFSAGSKGYIGIGYGGVGTNDVWEYDPSSNSWTQKANMGPFTRFGAVCFTIGTKVYAGTGVSSVYLNDFWEYNTVTDTWTQKANFGGNPKIYATGFSIGANGYLGTGAEYSNIGIGTNDFWEYDTTSNSWTQKASVPGMGRSEAMGFSIGNYGYIGIGTNNWGIAALSDFWKYNPATDTWTAAAVYPGGTIEEATGFVIDCKAYVGTGFTNDYSTSVQTGFWEYTPDSNCTNIDDSLPASIFAVMDTDLCEKFCTDFFDSSLNNPTAWQWSFPGGTPATSTNQNPTNICYNNPGVYDVTLITTNAFGSDTLTLSNYITVYSNPFPPVITQNGNVLTSSPASSYQWQLNAVDIPGATNQSYTILQSGLYTVIISNENGCNAQASADAFLVGIENISPDFEVNIFPNPSSGNFTIDLQQNELSKNISIDVVNTIGQVVFTSSRNGSSHNQKIQVDLGSAARGIYFVQIKTTRESVTRKILISD